MQPKFPGWPGLLRDKTAAGTIRWRVRVEGDKTRKIKLTKGPGEEGFEEQYLAARAGEKPSGETTSSPNVLQGSFDAIAIKYIDWFEIQVRKGNFSSLTLESRRRGLQQARDVRDHHGDRLGEMDPNFPKAAFKHIVDSFGDRTAAAETCLKSLRAMFTWAEDRGFVSAATLATLRLIKSDHVGGSGAEKWTEKDLDAFARRHPAGSMARLWFMMENDLGNRISDAPLLGPGNMIVEDGVTYLDWQPRKKGSARVRLPLSQAFLEEWARHDARDTFLVTEFGKPFSSSGSLDNRVRKWIIQAGLCREAVDKDGNPILEKNNRPKIVATRSTHGIRKALATAAAERGCTEYELMAMFGWVEAKTAAVYTKNLDRARAAKTGVQKSRKTQGGPR